MKRFTCLTLLTFFAVAAGCSASSSNGSGSTDDDAGTTTNKDAGKKDGSSTTTDEGGTMSSDASTSKDAKAKDVVTDDVVDTDADTDATTTTDGSTGTDAATTDGSTAMEGGADADSGTLVCAPANVSGFTPTWKQPNALHQNKCTTAQVDAIMDACADSNSTQQACDAALAAAPTACTQCLVTDESAATYGAIVVTFQGVFWNLNVAGCIARTQNDLATTSCGAKVQAYSQCESAACDANCANISDINDYYTCQDTATAGGCASYSTAADTCKTAAFAMDGGAHVCDPSVAGTFLDNAKIYGKLFCTP